MAVGTIIGIIGSLAAAGISAAAQANKAKAEEEELKKQRSVDAGRFKEQMQAQRRQQGQTGLSFLSNQRQQAVANAPFNTRPSFARDITRIARGEI
jgi:hypothetical protein